MVNAPRTSRATTHEAAVDGGLWLHEKWFHRVWKLVLVIVNNFRRGSEVLKRSIELGFEKYK